MNDMCKPRPRLDAGQQIAHLLSKGVKFELVSESDALAYLKTNNNYFKLRAYRKAFEKRPDGTYINLDFGYLRDLSIIDMLLRYCLLHMCLDVEHFEKVALMRRFDESTEDGYQIVRDFKIEHKDHVDHAHVDAANSAYCHDLLNKYQDDMPIWAFLEIVNFGTFLRFYKFCSDRFGDSDMEDEWYVLMTIKHLRNAAAHNNCIVNEFSPKTSKYRANYRVTKYLGDIGILGTARDRKMSCERLRQIATLFYLYDRLMPQGGVRRYRANDMRRVMDRMYRHFDYYKECEMITSSFDFIKKMVDNTLFEE